MPRSSERRGVLNCSVTPPSEQGDVLGTIACLLSSHAVDYADLPYSC